MICLFHRAGGACAVDLRRLEEYEVVLDVFWLDIESYSKRFSSVLRGFRVICWFHRAGGVWVVGPWQWPYRGVRVGEASHPGPAIDIDVDDMSATLPPSTGGDVYEEHRGESVDMLTAERNRIIDELFEAPPTPVLQPATPTPVLRCPLCIGYTTRGVSRGLMAHLIWRHHGECLLEAACEVLPSLLFLLLLLWTLFLSV